MAFQFTQYQGGYFDPRSVDPAQFTQLPLAEYKVVIIDSEPVQNKGGGHLCLTLKIIEGQYVNSELQYNLNIFHTDEKVRKISERQLSAVAHVTGNGGQPLQNSQQLHNIPFIALIGPQEGNTYNHVKLVKDINGNVPGKANSNPVAAQPIQVQPQLPPQGQSQQQSWPPANNAPQQASWPPPATSSPMPQPNFGPPQTQFQPAPQQPVQTQPDWTRTAPPAQPPQQQQWPPQPQQPTNVWPPK